MPPNRRVTRAGFLLLAQVNVTDRTDSTDRTYCALHTALAPQYSRSFVFIGIHSAFFRGTATYGANLSISTTSTPPLLPTIRVHSRSLVFICVLPRPHLHNFTPKSKSFACIW